MKSKKLIFLTLIIQLLMFTQKQLKKFKVPKRIFPEELIKSCDRLSSVMVSKKLMKKKLFSNLKTKKLFIMD